MTSRGIRGQRRYWIQLRGFDGHEVLAPNAAKAKADTFRAWTDAGYGARRPECRDRPFKQFLDRIEAFYALGVAEDLDPRTPEYGVAR